MDNYTLIQNAARRHLQTGGRTGFAALSRIDQSDQWTAWQASADFGAAASAPTDTYADESRPPDDAGIPPAAPSLAEARLPQPPEPPRPSFALYKGIVDRQRSIFGPQL